MKTPEEWQEDIEACNLKQGREIEIIKLIQLDAWKQGMLDAAIHCTNFDTSQSIHISNQLLAIKDTKKL